MTSDVPFPGKTPSNGVNSQPGGKRMNRLARETSPYLLQHAGNPVDWHPWDEEALALARNENKPIFLSIGYSACHWCHVMERESFENEVLASFMNDHFVNIKVDREERPDLDDIYMNAVNAMTGNGGWPLSVFLTPDLKPFYGGTYFPSFGRYGMPSFLDVLQQIVHIWHKEPSRALTAAEQLTAHLRECFAVPPAGSVLPVKQMRQQAASQLESSFDKQWGGWGGAPKFPSPASVSFLLRQHQRTGDRLLLDMAVVTLRNMASGGLYDHVGGGFHRYSTDEKWRVPHFEKMLYDNAQLPVAYLEAWQAIGDPFFKEVACETLDYVLRDLRDPEGGFYSSEDADSEGEEGRFYLWTRQEILTYLGLREGDEFCRAYFLSDKGNFDSHEPCHHKRNILYRNVPGNDYQNEREGRYTALRAVLQSVRNLRVRPACDDKIITAWNALMISALARAAFAWKIPAFKEAACKAAAFIEGIMLSGDTLYRTWRRGSVRHTGYLDDYAFTANAFIDLYESTADAHWLETAKRLADLLKNRFAAPRGGGFYSTDASHSGLLVRVRSLHDTAEPSPNAQAALALARLGRHFSLPEVTALAEKSVAADSGTAKRMPLACLHTLLAADYLEEDTFDIVFCGLPASEDMEALKEVLSAHFVPSRVIAYTDAAGDPLQRPLCASKTMLDNRATVYVCRNNRCLPPVNTPAAFEQLLSELL